jgi:hypothetical protein
VIAGPARCGMIVGPGESLRWLDRVLRHARLGRPDLVVWSDGADRDTRLACEAAERHGDPLRRQLGFEFDESAVRNEPDGHARRRRRGRPVVMLDADEQLHSDGSDPRPRRARGAAHDRGVERRVHARVGARPLRHSRRRRLAPHYRSPIYRHQRRRRIQPRQLACGAVPATPGTPPPRRQPTVMHSATRAATTAGEARALHAHRRRPLPLPRPPQLDRHRPDPGAQPMAVPDATSSSSTSRQVEAFGLDRRTSTARRSRTPPRCAPVYSSRRPGSPTLTSRMGGGAARSDPDRFAAG